MHLKSIYEEEELTEGATIKDFLIVQKEIEEGATHNMNERPCKGAFL